MVWGRVLIVLSYGVFWYLKILPSHPHQSSWVPEAEPSTANKAPQGSPNTSWYWICPVSSNKVRKDALEGE